jgi:aryl-alcohol dehydrogenase-like predicted oxidoreductase
MPWMRYGTIPGLDRPVSRIVLGTMAFSPQTQAQNGAMLGTFLARGGNLIDTAPVYRGGGSEWAIGDWLQTSGKRDELLILTKGAHHAPDGTKRVNPEEIAFDLGQSLARLRTRYVDLYLLHRDDPQVAVGPIVETLNYQTAKGRMRAFGGSNWTHQRLQEARDYAQTHDLQPFVASSPNLSLAVPKEPMWPDCVSVSGDAPALEWYHASQLPLLSWSSQGGGFFSGRFIPERTDDANMVRVYYNEANWERLRRATHFGQQLGLSAIQIALAWVLSLPNLPTFALIGPRSVEELESSLAVADLELTPDQVAWLNLEV